ncbi:DUF397 domain-containing protein [Micromonospora vulcania]|uniref:DUF397 domain-containing protein n=1 Tax=Micromonospora vulcania TaxID=1441873 RepID=A0ABW1HCY7_9ACTN
MAQVQPRRQQRRHLGRGSSLDTGAAVRESQDQQGPALSFTTGQWTGFVHGIRAASSTRQRRQSAG